MGTGWLSGWAVAAVLSAQTPARAPIAASPVIELRGRIASVGIALGQGMPYLEIDTGSGRTTLRLGSMRYLMAQNFNPQAGREVFAKAYRVAEREAVAITVKLAAEGKELRLRDENGWPVWGRGRWGRR